MPGTRTHAAGPAARHWTHQDQDPRLYPTRNAHPVCGAQLSRRQADHPPRQASPPPEWLAFLKTIDRETPPDLDIHLIADNYATHKHAEVKRWLAKHPRFHMHFTPTSSSW